jgi:Kef-type K+ transport system membrane component KefB
VFIILSAVLGSAVLGNPNFADWSLIAAQVCIWLAMSFFLGYFFHGCASDIRQMS